MSSEATLEQALIWLAGQTAQAEQLFESQLRNNGELEPDEELDFAGEHQLWLSLEEDVIVRDTKRAWVCGWRIHADEATTWAINARAATPLDAAQALVERLGGRHE